MEKTSKVYISKILIFLFLFFIFSNSHYSNTGNEKAGLKLIKIAEKLYSTHSFQRSIDTYAEALTHISNKKNLARLYLGLSKSYYALGLITNTKEILRKMINLNLKQKFNKNEFPREYLKILENITPDIIPQENPEIIKEPKEKILKTKKNVIEVKGEKKKKKKFPILIVAGGLVIIAILAAVLSKKKSAESTSSKFTLNVNVGDGINGNPSSGAVSYNEGASVNYSYTLQDGFQNLIVQLDGENIADSGTITMDRNHSLSATAGLIDGSKVYLNVSVGEGVEGTPSAGTTYYDKGTNVSYSYSLKSGYSNLEVKLDGNIVSSSGSITMNENHTLSSNTSQSGDSSPTVSITSPQNGSKVSGTISIDIDASDESGIDNVECLIDGSQIGTDSTQPYNFSWDTSGYSEGSHEIKVWATNNNAQSSNATISVIVDNYTENPTIDITDPPNNATVGSYMIITANGHDDLSIDYMQFLIDDSVIRETSHNYGGTDMGWTSDMIDMTGFSNGSHTLKGRIYDMEGNIGEHTITIIVSN